MRPNHNFGVPPELVQDREVCAILARYYYHDAFLTIMATAVQQLMVMREEVDRTLHGPGVSPKVCVTRLRYTMH